ncbi:MAG: hypothetical protein WCW87_00665 [Candidatus Paceibacterota bacterium]
MRCKILNSTRKLLLIPESSSEKDILDLMCSDGSAIPEEDGFIVRPQRKKSNFIFNESRKSTYADFLRVV